MAHRQILDVRTAPDLDTVHIPAQQRVALDGTVITQLHIADDLAGRVQIHAVAESGESVEVVG